MDEAPARVPRRFPKPLKYLLVALAALVAVLAAGIGYIAATFDPRDHHQRVIDLVRDKTGRTLEIRGETALSLWPDLAVRAGPLTLSERGSAEVFAAVDSVRVRLELKALLSREIVVTELAVSGAAVRITRDAEGRLNIADLIGGEGEPPHFDIGRVAIERSTIVYRDLSTGAHYEIGELGVETGRLTPGRPIPVTLTAHVRPGKNVLGMQVSLVTRLKLDPKQKRSTLTAPKIDIAGAFGEDALTLAASAATVSIAPPHMEGEGLRLALLAKGPAGTTRAKLALPSVTSDGNAIESPAAALELALARGDHRIDAAIATPLEVDLAARTLALTRIDASFTAFGPRLPRKGIEGEMKGEARLDVAREGVQARLAGKVGGSGVKAQIVAAGFASPVYTFDVAVDRLDLDRYSAGPAANRKPARAGGVQDLLDALDGLPASGTLTIGVLESGGVKATGVKVALK